jgi:hypothetical protein
MTLCLIVLGLSTLLLLYVLFMDRHLLMSKEGFVEYIVYGPGPWWGMGPRRRWWHRRWFHPYMWPGRAAWFY